MKQKEDLFEELKKYTLISRVVLFLDAILAGLIAVFSHRLISTEFGRASLIFGFIMLSFVTLLGILKKWGPK